jgi:flagellar basal-body rod modification protein FlgD
MADVNPTSSYNPYQTMNSGGATRGSGSDIGTDTFLQLLITQMRYQDPFSGGQDMGDFMNQVAQFTMLERLIRLQQSMDAFTEQQGYTQALNLLSRNVEVNVEGTVFQGEVTAVRFVGGQPLIRVNGIEYPLNAIALVE